MIRPAVGAFVMGIFLLIAKEFLPVSIKSMILLTGAGAVVYGTSMLSMTGMSLIADVKKSFKTLINKAG